MCLNRYSIDSLARADCQIVADPAICEFRNGRRRRKNRRPHYGMKRERRQTIRRYSAKFNLSVAADARKRNITYVKISVVNTIRVFIQE